LVADLNKQFTLSSLCIRMLSVSVYHLSIAFSPTLSTVISWLSSGQALRMMLCIGLDLIPVPCPIHLSPSLPFRFSIGIRLAFPKHLQSGWFPRYVRVVSTSLFLCTLKDVSWCKMLCCFQCKPNVLSCLNDVFCLCRPHLMHKRI
jgi:hypothetical protein